MTNTAQKPNVADQITLADLIDDPILGDIAVRDLCKYRKILNNHDGRLSDATIELEMDISRAYFDLGPERRSEAFENGQQRFKNRLNEEQPKKAVVIELQQKPKLQPKYALVFSLERSSALIRLALTNLGSGKSVTFAALKKAVELLHLGEGEEWNPVDLKVQSNNLKAWENRIQNELVKLRKQDVVHYRATKGDYFIF